MFNPMATLVFVLMLCAFGGALMIWVLLHIMRALDEIRDYRARMMPWDEEDEG